MSAGEHIPAIFSVFPGWEKRKNCQFPWDASPIQVAWQNLSGYQGLFFPGGNNSRLGTHVGVDRMIGGERPVSIASFILKKHEVL